MNDDLRLNGNVYLEEGYRRDKEAKIHGVAIHPGKTDHSKDKDTAFKNERIYLLERLKNAAPSLIGKPIFVNHNDKQEKVGIVTLARWDEEQNGIYYEGTVSMEYGQKIARGEITAVSVGANPWVKGGGVEWLNGFAPYGFVFEELSLIDPKVMIPGDPNAWVTLCEGLQKKRAEIREGIAKEKQDELTAQLEKQVPDKYLKNPPEQTASHIEQLEQDGRDLRDILNLLKEHAPQQEPEVENPPQHEPEATEEIVHDEPSALEKFRRRRMRA